MIVSKTSNNLYYPSQSDTISGWRLGGQESYFKFENWWLETEKFKDRVKGWWESLEATGRPDFVFATKLKLLKDKLKEWNSTNYGSLEKKKLIF